MTDRGSRQGFLGDEADEIFSHCRVAVVGLGGGGSHIVQQLAHAGFRRFVLYDPDVIEATNLNRLVGATEADARDRARKVDVAAHLIRGLCANPIIDVHAARWEEEPHALRSCDLVFGCLDGLAARRDLEASTRRYLLPLIDIGLDVTVIDGEPPQMAGQVILSMPGEACMACLGFLTPANLAKEAGRYGDAGIRPQVVWGNGVPRFGRRWHRRRSAHRLDAQAPERRLPQLRRQQARTTSARETRLPCMEGVLALPAGGGGRSSSSGALIAPERAVPPRGEQGGAATKFRWEPPARVGSLVMGASRLTREALYDLVWSKPMTAVAADYGMSSVAFAKHCKKAGVPYPWRGYWAQVSAKQKPKRTPLPKADSPMPREIILEERTRPPPRTPRGEAPGIVVDERLAKPHAIVKQLGELLRPSFKHQRMLTVRGESSAVLKVGEPSKSRALRILDALIKYIERVGHEVRLRLHTADHPARSTYALEIVVRDEPVALSLTEHVDRTERPPADPKKSSLFDQRFDFSPSGRLTLELQAPWSSNIRHRWRDGEKRRLEDVLGEVVLGLEDVAGAWTDHHRRQSEAREVEATSRRRREREARAAAHLKLLEEDLSNMATAWCKAETIRQYLDAAERAVGAPPPEGFSKWIAWARQFAQRMDPVGRPGLIAKRLEPDEDDAESNRR